MNFKLLSQTNSLDYGLVFPQQNIYNELSGLNNNNDRKSNFKLSLNAQTILNNGHPNIDNSAEIFVVGSSANFFSARFEYFSTYLSLSLEPYEITHNSIIKIDGVSGSYQMTNNHTKIKFNKDTGFRQSKLSLHYKDIGISYGYMSHWWGPGLHSSISLSSNAPSQETFSFGTFKDINLGKFSFGSEVIVMPYTSSFDQEIFFSGLKAHLSYISKSSKSKIGFHRTYLSGNFKNLSSSTISTNSWSIEDAVQLVFEPLFGQSKKNLSYTEPGTPGFDAWDEILTAYAEVDFFEQELRVYAEVSSDDNRANFTDLRAHWDHTLGYLYGFNKIIKLNQNKLILTAEYLSTKISNTFNPKFYRGDPNKDNYYTKDAYDYFSYENRRIGAHSGTSSDDLFFAIGYAQKNQSTIFTINKERHGIKSMENTELKTEYSLSFYKAINKKNTLFVSVERENIINFGFIENGNSVSNFLWAGIKINIK